MARTRKTKTLVQGELERDIATRAARERKAERDAEIFWQYQRQALSSPVPTLFDRDPRAAQNEIDMARDVIQRERQPLVRVVDPETLAKCDPAQKDDASRAIHIRELNSQWAAR